MNLKKLAAKAYEHRQILLAAAVLVAPKAVEKASAKVKKLKRKVRGRVE